MRWVGATSGKPKTANAISRRPNARGNAHAFLNDPAIGLVPEEGKGVDQLRDTLVARLQRDKIAWDSLPPVPLSAAVQAEEISWLLLGKVIAVACDVAITFLYPSNLPCLRKPGAKRTYFSPLDDEPVSANADAVYLPGGRQRSGHSMRRSTRYSLNAVA